LEIPNSSSIRFWGTSNEVSLGDNAMDDSEGALAMIAGTGVVAQMPLRHGYVLVDSRNIEPVMYQNYIGSRLLVFNTLRIHRSGIQQPVRFDQQKPWL
jgi:hypothetical protein